VIARPDPVSDPVSRVIARPDPVSRFLNIINKTAGIALITTGIRMATLENLK